jgi:hypothetical protein
MWYTTVWTTLLSADIVMIHTVCNTDLKKRAMICVLTDTLGDTFESTVHSRILFREMRCEVCRQPLREYFYYKCVEGCVRSVETAA